jgi:hypothetical protein
MVSIAVAISEAGHRTILRLVVKDAALADLLGVLRQ